MSVSLTSGSRFLALSFAIIGLSACGSSDQSASNLQQLINISVTAQSTADTRGVYSALKDIYEAADPKGEMPAAQLFSILAMQSSEKQKLANAYSVPLAIACEDGLCKVSGQGQAVSAQTEVSGGGINRPVLGLGTSIAGTFMFTSTGLLRACGLSGVTVRKLFITKQVQGVEIQVGANGVRTVVDAGDSGDNFICDVSRG
jgi:hypothetical protein